jgi:hypothetical protein
MSIIGIPLLKHYAMKVYMLRRDIPPVFIEHKACWATKLPVRDDREKNPKAPTGRLSLYQLSKAAYQCNRRFQYGWEWYVITIPLKQNSNIPKFKCCAAYVVKVALGARTSPLAQYKHSISMRTLMVCCFLPQARFWSFSVALLKLHVYFILVSPCYRYWLSYVYVSSSLRFSTARVIQRRFEGWIGKDLEDSNNSIF